ncbi:N-alpha-acetyltransferase 38, NatC auxiliary subunit [Aethina tumida]|uniref:N-alpha-acetyltransferase 38, NatC auxiliary subunit n=1 Tax=Aethina tumida TaxID=116153 RepID=UPI00096B172D|nr:N-alpha-acetyltransferase 38, NatC auxiliary subunit [Aethina tumida]XP_049825889.1 N-alpha-acetyltransferase 38, NatC auxiliary subunit [Aethina tumida]
MDVQNAAIENTKLQNTSSEPTEDNLNKKSEASGCLNADIEHSGTTQENELEGVAKLRSWLNKPLRIKMTDGRTLIGVFFCTDRDANIILGSCTEYLPISQDNINDDRRMLGLVMIPGRHIVKVELDLNENYSVYNISDQDDIV